MSGPRLKTLHLAPGDSAAGSLRQAIRLAGLNDEVLANRDDLSCGPIGTNDSAERVEWWARFYDFPEVTADSEKYWNRLGQSDDRLIVWFGRRSASELAFFHCLAERLGDRPYDVIDATDHRWSFVKDGVTRTASPGILSWIPEQHLLPLLGSERPITPEQKSAARERWRRLRQENAPFRIVTPDGLTSAPIDHFDPILLRRATKEWIRTARIVGDTMGSSDLYYQVGDLMLLTRVVALVEQGKLLADGDPWDMHSCRVRLPE